MTGEEKSGGIEQPILPLSGRRGVRTGGPVRSAVQQRRHRRRGPFTNPRAANVLPNRDRAITLGGNWYINRYGRVLFNAVRETIQDPPRSPLADRTHFWTGVFRLQFVM